MINLCKFKKFAIEQISTTTKNMKKSKKFKMIIKKLFLIDQN